MNHYFIENESLLKNEREISFTFMGGDFIFKTNNGLFSNKEVDYASRLLMENIPALIPGSFLDMGCGYGVVGIVLAKNYGMELTVCDINASAVKYALINAGINGVKCSAAYSEGISSVNGTFDVIVTNPPIHTGKENIFQMYSQAAGRLKNGGAFYLVIQKKHGAESHAFYLKNIFKNVDTLYKRKGYLILRCLL